MALNIKICEHYQLGLYSTFIKINLADYFFCFQNTKTWFEIFWVVSDSWACENCKIENQPFFCKDPKRRLENELDRIIVSGPFRYSAPFVELSPPFRENADLHSNYSIYFFQRTFLISRRKSKLSHLKKVRKSSLYGLLHVFM